MNFNKCDRCGCFYVTEGITCPSCTPKDSQDISKLNSFFSNNEDPITVTELSSITGISQKNINRFVNNKNFEFTKQIML